MDPYLIAGGVAVLAALRKQIGAAAMWVLRTLANGLAAVIVAKLDDRLGLDSIRENLNPPSKKWPNGSDDLPASISEIYRRQSETHRQTAALDVKVDNVLTQLKRLNPPVGGSS